MADGHPDLVGQLVYLLNAASHMFARRHFVMSGYPRCNSRARLKAPPHVAAFGTAAWASLLPLMMEGLVAAERSGFALHAEMGYNNIQVAASRQIWASARTTIARGWNEQSALTGNEF